MRFGTEPVGRFGVGFEIIKGEQLLREVMADGAKDIRVNAIKCIEAEQVVAFKRVHGERDMRN